MKRSLFFTFFILSAFCGHSQCFSYPVSLDKRIENSTYIIEGTVESQRSFYNEDKSKIVTAHRVLIYKVLKGKKIEENIEIITDGGKVDDKILIVQPSTEIKVGDVGVFFLENELLINEKKFHPIYTINQGFIKYDPISQTAVDLYYKYEDINVDLLNKIIDFNKDHYEEREKFNASEFIKNNRSGNNVSSTPQVTYFSPDTIAAGARKILSIHGTGFGTSFSGSANVYLKHCDYGNNTYNPIATSNRVISWSDTLIVIRIPSDVGTAPIYIVNSSGQSGSYSTSPLVIKYNVSLNGSNDSTIHISNVNGSGGYTYKYNQAFATNLNATGAFQRALDTWKCATGINRAMSANTTTATCSAGDVTCTMNFDNSCPLTGALAVAYSWISAYTDYYWLSEVDIIFDDAPTGGWYFGSNPSLIGPNEYTFEGVALHELGHAHLVNHTTTQGEVMGFNASGTLVNYLSKHEKEGGRYVIGISKIPNSHSLQMNPTYTYSVAISKILDSVFTTTSAASYQWYFNNSIIAGANNPYYIAGITGNYFVEVEDTTRCY